LDAAQFGCRWYGWRGENLTIGKRRLPLDECWDTTSIVLLIYETLMVRRLQLLNQSWKLTNSFGNSYY
jgi:hypothetical protein